MPLPLPLGILLQIREMRIYLPPTELPASKAEHIPKKFWCFQRQN